MKKKMILVIGLFFCFLLLLISCQSGKTVAGKAVEGELCSDANPCDAGLVCINEYCLTDYDSDTIADEDDNCPSTKNPLQHDGDRDGVGDDCEADNLFFAPSTACVISDSVQFIEFAGEDDGILVFDRNHNGEIQRQDMFGAKYFTGRDVANSFEDLRLLDADVSGTLDADDPLFSELRVWKNSGVLLTLADAGVAGTNLAYRDTGEEVIQQLGTYKSTKAVELEGEIQTLQIQAELEVENNLLAGSAWLKTTTGTGNIFILDLDGDGVETRDDLVVGDAIGDKVCLSVGGCGDSVVEGTEQCDDGNTDDTDLCLSSCTYRTLSKDDLLSELINQLDSEESDAINRKKVKMLFTKFLYGLQSEEWLQ